MKEEYTIDLLIQKILTDDKGWDPCRNVCRLRGWRQ